MTWSVLVSPEAEEDIQDAHAWYQVRRFGLGDEFLESLRETFAMLERHPTIFAEVVPDVRALLVNRFPYVVYFTAIEATVHVIGVIHASRDPMVWQSRVPKTVPK